MIETQTRYGHIVVSFFTVTREYMMYITEERERERSLRLDLNWAFHQDPTQIDHAHNLCPIY
jgi:hypothetical protein